MKMNTLLATAFVSSFLVAPAHSFACGDAAEWANPNAATPAISLENFITYAPLAHDVIISQSHFQARCGDDINFDVVDALSSKTLGRIPVSQNAVKADDGRVLSVRLTQLLKTSRMQLVNVENAIRIFHDDVDALTEDLGIGASFSYALPNRTKNQDRVFLVDVNIKTYCWEDRQRSPYTVHQNLPIKTLRYIPGRTNYPANSIYQQGDLRRAILNNIEIINKIKRLVADNVMLCPDGVDEFSNKTKWKEISSRLNGPKSELMKSAVQRFKSITEKAMSAYMLNKNSISIQYKQGEIQFAGTISEMVEIQSLLSDQNIIVDKENRLDITGRIEVSTAKELGLNLPTSLQ